MAKLTLCVSWEDVALVAGSWKTVACVAAASQQPLEVLRARLATDGVAGGAIPLGFRLHRVTSDGTGTAFTPVTVNETNTTAPRSTAKVNYTAEPTLEANKPLFPDKFHPQGGEAQDFTFVDLEVKAAGFLAVQVRLPAAQTVVNCSGHLVYRE